MATLLPPWRRRPRSASISPPIDKTADPCTDFNQYVCGNWKKNNPIPADKVRWGQFDELRERNDYLLYLELKAAAAAPSPSAVARVQRFQRGACFYCPLRVA